MSQPKKISLPLHGWIALDKPYGMGSTQAVSALKRLFHPKKIGHGGTLDPLATGCLPIAMGEATKTVSYMMDATKTYQFEIYFGAETTTLDSEGEVVQTSDVRPTAQQIIDVLPRFMGNIQQIPPVFSALMIDGKRAYDLARAGVALEMKPRAVTVHLLELLELKGDKALMEVTCGKGTYVRSLARDIAYAVGSVGHVTMLRRLRVGKLDASVMFSLEKLEKMVYDFQLTVNSNEDVAVKSLKSLLLYPDAVLDDIPVLRIDKLQHTHLLQGKPLFYAKDRLEDALSHILDETSLFRIYGEDGLVALGQWKDGEVRSRSMFMM
jgi:tRNA pseudouridine55 synthase